MLEGEHALIGHLTELMQEKDQKNTPHTIRLESDANLVKVVTIHKSKGLEYPLVFVPFICNARQTKASDIPLKYHTPEGKLKLALEPDAPILQWANEERLAEDVRKLYVALTRARYATWLGLAPIADFSDSGLGYLLDGRYQEGSDELAADRTCVNIMDMAPEEPADATELAPAPHAIEIPPTKAWGPARQAQRNLHEYWQMASYSTMRYQTAADSAQEAIFHEVASDESAALAPSLSESHTPSSGLLHGFPRGTAAGTFLHELMEWACHEGFGHLVQFPNKVHETVLKRCQSRQWDEMAQPLTDWLLIYIQQPITSAVGTHFSLAQLPATSTVVEMEFWLSVHHVSIEHLDRLVCKHTLDAAERPALEPKHLHGMLKGFIDLVLEHDGRYYVVDYKSNYLGATDSAYTAQAMKEAILKSRYELQYVLYLLAVHRLLKLRLPDYDYDQHMGGAIYLFLRGDQAPTRGIHAERPPRELIEALDQLFTAPHAHDAA